MSIQLSSGWNDAAKAIKSLHFNRLDTRSFHLPAFTDPRRFYVSSGNRMLRTVSYACQMDPKVTIYRVLWTGLWCVRFNRVSEVLENAVVLS